MKKYAILDIGTNSSKLFLFSVDNDIVSTLIDRKRISRLGKDLSTNGKISIRTMNDNIKVLDKLIEIARKEEVDEICAIGTMCLRKAKNSEAFINRVNKELNLDIEVISGKEEARLSFLAVTPMIEKHYKNIVVFDIGGGSTELILAQYNKLIDQISLDLDLKNLTEKFLLSDPVKKYDFRNMMNYLTNFFREEVTFENVDLLIGIGGTVTNMGAVMHKMLEYNPRKIHGSKMSFTEVNKQIKMYRSKTINERKKIPGLHPKRAKIILSGASIIKILMEKYNMEVLTMSDHGLRHGLMIDRYLKKTKE